MKEILKIKDKSKAVGCKFKIDEFNLDSNKNSVISRYNEIQRTRNRLNEARESVRLLENLLNSQEEEFRLIEPLIELEFNSFEKEWESREINGAVINHTDYRNTNI